MRGSLLLALKAEALLGLHLVTRHRAPRLAAALGLALVAAAAVSRAEDTSARMVLLIGSTVAAVGGSRLLANGPALASGRMVLARWWVVPVGRVAGALTAVAPFALGVALLGSGLHGDQRLWRVAWVCGGYGASLMACTMAITPGLGASAAATLTCLAVWLGTVPPSAVWVVLAPWPLVRWCAFGAWSALPLPWRALRWLAGGPSGDGLLVLAWGCVAVGLAGWQLWVPSSRRASRRRIA